MKINLSNIEKFYKYTHSHTLTDNITKRHIDRQSARWMDIKTDRQRYWHTNEQINRMTD